MAFHDVTAEVSTESRFALAKVAGETLGIEKFEVTTIRRLYWQRAWEMVAHSGDWERRQTVGVFPRGGHGVFETTFRWPSY